MKSLIKYLIQVQPMIQKWNNSTLMPVVFNRVIEDLKLEAILYQKYKNVNIKKQGLENTKSQKYKVQKTQSLKTCKVQKLQSTKEILNISLTNFIIDY